MSRVIFLDIDGVLNSHFRNDSHQSENMFIEDITPDHSTEEIRNSKKFSLVKAGEILAWLAAHEEVDSWIVIDDLDLHNAEIEMHQIKTDPSVGLTFENICKAEKMLR